MKEGVRYRVGECDFDILMERESEGGGKVVRDGWIGWMGVLVFILFT